MRAEERRLWQALRRVSRAAPRARGSPPTPSLTLPLRSRSRSATASSISASPLALLAPALLWLGLRGLAPRRARRAALRRRPRRPRAGPPLDLRRDGAPTGTPRRPSASSRRSASPPGSRALQRGSSAAPAPGSRAPGSPSPSPRRALGGALDQLRSLRADGLPVGDARLRAPPRTRRCSASRRSTGVYGLCFAAALGGAVARRAARGRRAALARGARGARRRSPRSTALGAARSAPRTARAPREHGPRRASLQGNIDQGVKWSARVGRADARRLRGADAQRGGARARSWSCGPRRRCRARPTSDPALRERLEALARETRATLVVGAVGVEARPCAGARPAALLRQRLRGRTRRRHRRSLRQDAPRALRRVRPVPRPARPLRLGGRDAASRTTDVTAGRGAARASTIPLAGRRRRCPSGVPICYELLFPDLMRRFAADGGRVAARDHERRLVRAHRGAAISSW